MTVMTHGWGTLPMSKLDDSDARTKFAHGPGGGGALYAEAPVGDPRGYATLETAIAAVAPLSTDEGGNPSSVVFHGDDGRFYAREVTSRSGLERHQPYHRGAETDHLNTTNYKIDEQIAALVDGYTVTRFDGKPGDRMWLDPVHPVRDLDFAVTVHDTSVPYSQTLKSIQVLGAKEGYSSLADAVAAMHELTGALSDASKGSAVIYRDGPRYYARELMSDDRPPKRTDDRKWLERFDASGQQGRIVFNNPTIEAVVSGDMVTYGWRK